MLNCRISNSYRGSEPQCAFFRGILRHPAWTVIWVGGETPTWEDLHSRTTPKRSPYIDKLARTISGAVTNIPGRLDGLLWVHTLVDGDCEERRKHLLPGHVAEINGPVRIRIELVVRRIVVVRGVNHLSALRHLYRFSEIVAKLPIEIVAGNVQHNPFLPVGKDQLVCHIFAAHVHMRRHPMQLRVDQERELGRFRRIVGSIGWNRKIRGICPTASLDQPALWRFFGNRETYLRPISGCGAVRSVMDAPGDIVTCRHQQRRVVRAKIRKRTARHVTANVLLNIAGTGGSIGRNVASLTSRELATSSIRGWK